MEQDDERMWMDISRRRGEKDEQIDRRNAHSKSEHNLCVRTYLEQQIARRSQCGRVEKNDCTTSGMFSYRVENDETRRQRRTICQQNANFWLSQAEEKLRNERAERRAEDEHQLATLRAIDLRADSQKSHQRLLDNRREARQYLDFVAAQRDEKYRADSLLDCPNRCNGDGGCPATQRRQDAQHQWSTEIRQQIEANRCQRLKDDQDCAAEAFVELELHQRNATKSPAIRK